MDVPAARRIARPGWINVRTLLGLVLFTAAVGAGGRFLDAADKTVPAWAAARDLTPGDAIGPGDVRAVEVNLPNDVAAGYVTGGTSVFGSVVTRVVAEGTLLPASAVALDPNAGPGLVVTVPVSPEHAVGGALRPGDLVDVFATETEAGPAACTSLVAHEVEVVDVVAAGGLVLEGEALAGVTIAVAPAEVAGIAHAIRTKEIDVARVLVPSRAALTTRVCGDDLR